MGSHLTVVLPGSGYAAVGAAIRVPVLTLEALGATTAVADYPDWRPSLADAAALDRFAAEVRAAVDRSVSRQRWDRVTVVAKSLGTIVLPLLGRDVFGDAAVDVVWVTPIFELDHVRAFAADGSWPALVVAGAADPSHHAEHHRAVVAASGGRELVVDGANHLLEIPGDVHATVDALHRVADAVHAFATR